MTKLEIRKSFLEGNIKCPPSKSYTHRAIAIASLAKGISKISNPLLSRDTIATISGCKMFGIKIEKVTHSRIIMSESILISRRLTTNEWES